MKTPAERIDKRRADMPELYRKLYDRCTRGTASPRDAIKMQCLECWGHVRSETATCDNTACPLWRYRPYQSAPPARQGDFSGAESTISENSGNDTPQAEMTSQNEKY